MNLQKLSRVTFFSLILISNLLFATAPKLTPPWYLLQTELATALSADSCVTVNPLQGEGSNMSIDIAVCDESKAQALAAYLSKRHEFNSSLTVSVNVLYENTPIQVELPDSLTEQVTLLNQALSGNKYFIKARLAPNPLGQPSAYAEFSPSVIQYFSDDISDWYLNTNIVAAELFSQLFNLHPALDDAVNIFSTTSKQK